MSTVKVEKATIKISETTLRELLLEIDREKERGGFIDDPPLSCDMSIEDAIEEDRKRGKLLIESKYSPIKFLIDVEIKPNTQESLGYHLHKNRSELPEEKQEWQDLRYNSISKLQNLLSQNKKEKE